MTQLIDYGFKQLIKTPDAIVCFLCSLYLGKRGYLIYTGNSRRMFSYARCFQTLGYKFTLLKCKDGDCRPRNIMCFYFSINTYGNYKKISTNRTLHFNKFLKTIIHWKRAVILKGLFYPVPSYEIGLQIFEEAYPKKSSLRHSFKKYTARE